MAFVKGRLKGRLDEILYYVLKMIGHCISDGRYISVYDGGDRGEELKRKPPKSPQHSSIVSIDKRSSVMLRTCLTTITTEIRGFLERE